MNRNLLFSTLLVAGTVLTSVPANAARVSLGISIGPPAPPPTYVVPAPRRGYVWVPGYYVWDEPARHHVWHDGYWVRERPGYHWREDRWVQRGPEWHRVPGGWVRG